MTSEEIFKFCNSVAMFTWIGLALFPYQKWLHRIVSGIIVAGFCILYAGMVLPALGAGDLSSFSSLSGVMQLFTHDKAVLAGWISLSRLRPYDRLVYREQQCNEIRPQQVGVASLLVLHFHVGTNWVVNVFQIQSHQIQAFLTRLFLVLNFCLAEK